MFINYIRIQFLRYFKGRFFVWQALISSALLLFTFLFSIGLIHLLKNGYVSLPDVDRNTTDFSYLPYVAITGSGLVASPIVLGVVVIFYVADYYKYRIHINLEVKLQNRISYAFSEMVIILIMCLVNLIILFLFIGFASLFYKMPIDVQEFRDLVNPISVALQFATLVNDSLMAYFLAKLFRRKLFPMVIYLVLCNFSTVVLNTLVTFMVYAPEEEFKMMAISLVVRSIIFFVGGALLFHRRYEERHV